MGGKATLILVLGVSYILMTFNTRTGNNSTTVLDNYLDYYSRTVAHQIAVSGMNIAAANLYADPTWRTPMNNVPFNGGVFNISFKDTGDTLKVKSTTKFDTIEDSVIAYFTGFNDLLKYTYFTHHENGVAWAPGDSIFGEIHTNGTLNHQNDKTIVFTGKVTAGKGIKPPPKTSKTQFLGGYEVGVYVKEVTDINNLKSAALSGWNYVSGGNTLKIEINNDGTVDVYENATKLYDDTLLSSLSPNGVIYTDGDLEIFGGGYLDTDYGGVTIGAGGNITLKDDIHYLDNPLTNPSSDDLLALVAWNDVIFDNQTKADWDVQSVLMSVNGSMTATQMNKNGTFNYLGSVYQSDRGNAKMFQSFDKKYRHDERLNTYRPPAYPGSTSLSLLYWWE
jgi:hypothetical protein